MGLGIKFSSSTAPRLGEPQAHRFHVERLEQVNRHVVALLRYPDATEYKGLKLLLYCNVTVEELEKATLLDPHFLENSSSPTPFARFEPTEQGLKAAFLLAQEL